MTQRKRRLAAADRQPETEDRRELVTTQRKKRLAAAVLAAERTDWDLLVAVLHPTIGYAGELVDDRLDRAVRSRCDGFGLMSAFALEEFGVLGDWNHVRDSTDRAIASAARILREALAQRTRGGS